MTDPDSPHQVVAEAQAAGARIDVALAQLRSRARIALGIVVVLVLALVAVGLYEVTSVSGAVGTITSNQATNRKTVVQTLEGLKAEYAVACGVANHYGVQCPPFPTLPKPSK